MAKFIMFGNQKGGVGKSQLTVITATALSADPFNRRVLVSDCDSQKSITHLRKMDQESGSFDSFNLETETVQGFTMAAKNYDEQFDIVFIDAAGKLDTDQQVKDQEVVRAMMYTDYLFIPFVQGNFNIESSVDYLKAVQQVRKLRDQSARPLHVIGMANMFDSRSNSSKYLIDDLRRLQEATEIKLMNTPLGRYTLHSEADTVRSNYSTSNSDRSLVNFREWMDEFCEIINLKP